jgi:predicted DNA-binding protein YlxM (UPF0122 family)
MSRLAPFDVNEAFRLYESGMTLKQIAKHFNVTRQAVHCRVIKLPNYYVVKRRTEPSFDVKEALHLYKGGMTLQGVANHYKISSKVVHYQFRKLPEYLRLQKAKGPTISFDVKEAFELFKTDVSVYEIASRIGVTKSTLYYHFDKVPEYHQLVKRYGPRVSFDVKEAFRLYESGLTFEEVGNRFGLTGKTIWKHITRLPTYKARCAKRRT